MGISRFRHLAIAGAGPGPTPAEIAALERQIGAALPRSFLSFLDVANGGMLDYFVDVDIPGGCREQLSFAQLLSTGRGVGGSFAQALQIRRDGVPRELLPFAEDGCGSSAFLDLSPEGDGRVVAFVLGIPAWTGLSGKSVWLRLAPSFDAYVEMLRPDREAVLEHLGLCASQLSHIEATEQWLDIAFPDWRTTDDELRGAVAAARQRVGGP